MEHLQAPIEMLMKSRLDISGYATDIFFFWWMGTLYFFHSFVILVEWTIQQDIIILFLPGKPGYNQKIPYVTDITDFEKKSNYVVLVPRLTHIFVSKFLIFSKCVAQRSRLLLQWIYIV